MSKLTYLLFEIESQNHLSFIVWYHFLGVFVKIADFRERMSRYLSNFFQIYGIHFTPSLEFFYLCQFIWYLHITNEPSMLRTFFPIEEKASPDMIFLKMNEKKLNWLIVAWQFKCS